MCILAFAWRAHPRWQLIVAGNRDEYHDRPSAPLARWDDRPHVIAGRDLRSGGGWLGVSEERRFAVVTNVRNPAGPDPALASRGALVADFLSGAGRYADTDALDPMAFNAFNLIAVEGERAVFVTNRPTAGRRDLAPGLYGLANGEFDAPWAKTVQLKSAVGAWMDAGADDPYALLAPLAWEAPGAVTGPDGSRLEPRDTPIFIRDPVYGTRCSTVVAIDRLRQGLIVERRFTATGALAGDTAYRFVWPNSSPA